MTDQNHSAFPILERGGSGLELTDAGMMLRDYFAAQVIGPAFLDLFESWRTGKGGVDADWPDGIAIDAYRVADAMMRARRKVND